MPKFVSTRHFPMDFLGKEWEKAFIIFRSLSVGESRSLINQKLGSKAPEKIIDITLKVLEDHFISGTAPNEKGELVKLTKEDISELPSQIMEKAVLFLVGGADSQIG